MPSSLFDKLFVKEGDKNENVPNPIEEIVEVVEEQPINEVKSNITPIVIEEKPIIAEQKFCGKFEVEDTNVIDFININKSFEKQDGSKFVLFKDLNLSIRDFKHEGQFITILGQSGCGKSQLLKMLSGLSKPDSGDIFLYGENIKNIKNHHIPMVFQQYSSYVWRTVIDNVALPLEMIGMKKKERYEIAMEMIKTVGLEGHENKWAKYPELSGGQLQRVAIARSLIASPQILLMDEPFGALDIVTRASMQDTLLDIFDKAQLDPTVIFVTHETREAVRLSNRIYILKANPCQIHEIIDVQFDGDRKTEFTQTNLFNDYINHIDTTMHSISQ